jgi:hypothetical protein
MELCERLAYYGMSTNLIVYLTSHLGVLSADAAVQLQVWGGCCYVTPLLGAYLADAYLGRYRTIISFSIVYLMVRGGPGLRPGGRSGSAIQWHGNWRVCANLSGELTPATTPEGHVLQPKL